MLDQSSTREAPQPGFVLWVAWCRPKARLSDISRVIGRSRRDRLVLIVLRHVFQGNFHGYCCPQIVRS
jgi:hypothetical protein